MEDPRSEWNEAKDELVRTIVDIGFPEEFGLEIAKGLGAPKAIRRVTSYLRSARPNDPETIVDEMLAIRSEIDSWHDKKRSEEANAKYNELLRYGLDGYGKKRCLPHKNRWSLPGAPIINEKLDVFHEVN